MKCKINFVDFRKKIESFYSSKRSRTAISCSVPAFCLFLAISDPAMSKYEAMHTVSSPIGKQAAIRIQYRFVSFGTKFEPADKGRPIGCENKPRKLHENEIALDVGGCCWGYDNCEQAVIDHHFDRPRQFPSASVAVVHLAEWLRQRFYRQHKWKNLWLVTHREPDFDALCSMYLAHHILTASADPPDWKHHGIFPDGLPDTSKKDSSRDKEVINWFDPELRGLTNDERWQVLLAAYASRLDNAMRIYCPPDRSLHSVLYAGMYRGRDYQDLDKGPLEFFDSVRSLIKTHNFNPLRDAIPNGHSMFAADIEFLSRDRMAYDRDLQRARRVLVSIPSFSTDSEFSAYYKRAASIPLLNSQFEINPAQMRNAGTLKQVDGIYIRDPESILFKEWARQDLQNSLLGSGFTFTAVANSAEKRGAAKNKTGYHFALDPERANGCHLYRIWAILQAAEVQQVRACPELQIEGAVPRPGFESRAGGLIAGFDDPWFDGVNYKCTIVPSPNRGSAIGNAGTRSDLLDDPIVAFVRGEIEHSIYAGGTITDYLAAEEPGLSASDTSPFTIGQKNYPLVPDGYLRFASIEVNGIANYISDSFSEQVGQALWSLLAVGETAVPKNFVDEHLVRAAGFVGIWNRRGICIAYASDRAQAVKALETQFGEMARLSRDLDAALQTGRNPTRDTKATRQLAEKTESLLLRIIDFKRHLAKPGLLLLRRLFHTIGLEHALETARDLYSTTIERDQRQRTADEVGALRRAYEKLEWIEVLIVAFYATEMTHMVLELNDVPRRIVIFTLLGVATLFGIFAFFGLVADRKKQKTAETGHLNQPIALKAIPVLLALLVLGLLLLTLFKPVVPTTQPTNEHHSQSYFDDFMENSDYQK